MSAEEQIQEYRDHIKDIDRQIATLEEAREYVFGRIDELQGE